MHVSKRFMSAGLAGLVLLAAPTISASAAPQTSAPAAEKVDDGTLKSRVLAKLKEDTRLAVRRVDVSVDRGVVILTGTVRTAEEKASAARLATMKGVTAVRNELLVNAAAADHKAEKALDATARGVQKGAEATAEAAQKAGEKTKEIAGKAAVKTRELVSATGEVITDSWLTAKVKLKIHDESALKGSEISVETTNRVVTLKGAVLSAAARTRAVGIANGTEGVARVVDGLAVIHK